MRILDSEQTIITEQQHATALDENLQGIGLRPVLLQTESLRTHASKVPEQGAY
jgi:hypothetical protein